MQAIDFITTILGDAEGYFFLAWKDDDGELNQSKAFKYPENKKAIERYIKVHTDEDLYFSPMLYSAPRRKTELATVAPVVWSDTDLFDPQGFRVRPSIHVQTSPDKSHSYWLLPSPVMAVTASDIARNIAHTHAEKVNKQEVGTDPSGWMMTKLLRVPGTVNTKYGQNYKVEVVWNDGTVYTTDDLNEAYPADEVPQKIIAGDAPMPDEDDLPDPAQVLNRVLADPTLNDLYISEPRGDWSDTLYLFESEMFRAGFTAEEVFVAAWRAACNKYRRDGRPESDLWLEIKRAAADPDNRPRPRVSDTPYAGDSTPSEAKEVADLKAMEKALLTEEERASLVRTFVDRYSTWGASKTDAPEAYHVASAFAIMSLILGEYGIAYPQFGPMRLGLFMVILGETTNTRKSTARSLMKGVIRLVQTETWDYILTADTTPESLIDALAERRDQSSLYDRDEAQELIADIKNKPYLQGFFETLNELYDGWARGRLRKGKSTKDTPVNFVQYLMGIRSQFQDQLELKDFASGWGPRQIFFRGEAAPRTREDNRLRQGSLDGGKVDKERAKIVTELVQVRNFWSNKVKDRAEPMPIMFDDDAWERWDNYRLDLIELLTKHDRGDILASCAERLGYAVLKAAVMFAMMNKREVANMEDVVSAIYYSLQWIEDLIIVVEGVSESATARQLREIEAFVIEKGGTVTYAALLKWSTRKNIRKQDFVEMLKTLSEMEILQLVEAKGKQSYRIV